MFSRWRWFLWTEFPKTIHHHTHQTSSPIIRLLSVASLTTRLKSIGRISFHGPTNMVLLSEECLSQKCSKTRFSIAIYGHHTFHILHFIPRKPHFVFHSMAKRWWFLRNDVLEKKTMFNALFYCHSSSYQFDIFPLKTSHKVLVCSKWRSRHCTINKNGHNHVGGGPDRKIFLATNHVKTGRS